MAAETLVTCWISADFQYNHVVQNMATIMKEKNEVYKREKYKKVFRYFLDEMKQHEEKLPPALNLKMFVKDTIGKVEEIEKRRLAAEKCGNDETAELADGESYADIVVIVVDDDDDSVVEVESEDDDNLLETLKDLNEKQDLEEMDEDDLDRKRREIERQLTEEGDLEEQLPEDGDLEVQLPEEADLEVPGLAKDPKLLGTQLDMLKKFVTEYGSSQESDAGDQQNDDENNVTMENVTANIYEESGQDSLSDEAGSLENVESESKEPDS